MGTEELPTWLLAAILVIGLGLPLLFLIAGIRLIRSALRFLRHGVWIMGTVVEVREIYHVGESGAQKYSYQPVFEFIAPDGTRLRGEAGSYGQTNRYPVGTQRNILVDFDNPEMVAMSRWLRFVTGVFVIVISLAFAAVVLIVATPLSVG